MSYAPASLTALRTLWTGAGGSFLGIIGSMTTHCGGYHLGRDRIFGDCACKPASHEGHCVPGRGSTDYSVANFPSRDGGTHCTNAAMAIDLGPIAGKPGSENDLARWLIDRCQAGDPDTKDIRGINYQLSRWDRIKGQASQTYQHTTDETGHVHIEWFRDSEGRDKTAAIKRWLGRSATTGGTAQVEEEGMKTALVVPVVEATVVGKAGTECFRLSAPGDPPPAYKPTQAFERAAVKANHVGGSTGWYIGLSGGDKTIETYWVRASDVTVKL